MASSIKEILLVILLLYAKVQQENAVAEQIDLSASSQNASDFNAASVEPNMPTDEPRVSTAGPSVPTGEPSVPTGEPSVPTGEPRVPTAEQSVSSGEPRVPASPQSPSGCPELCICKESEKREGIIVDCVDRKLRFVPDSIPDGAIYVNLKKNLIRSLTNASFAKWNTKSVQKINLSQNNISHIEKYAFKHFNHLWVIDLSGNNLTHVNKVRFPATHELNLEGNPMRLKPTSGFEESVFTSSQSLTGDCYAIYRRVKTNQMDDHWKYLEHVSHVIANIKCDRDPFLKRTSPMIVTPPIAPQRDVSPEGNATISTPKTNLSQNNHAVTIENNPTENRQNNTSENEPKMNHSETIATTTTTKERPTPTIYEAFFYGSLLVVFSLLILFLISQKYNHSCYRALRKKITRQSTRRSTGNGPVIHVHPIQRKQSHKPN